MQHKRFFCVRLRSIQWEHSKFLFVSYKCSCRFCSSGPALPFSTISFCQYAGKALWGWSLAKQVERSFIFCFYWISFLNGMGVWSYSFHFSVAGFNVLLPQLCCTLILSNFFFVFFQAEEKAHSEVRTFLRI